MNAADESTSDVHGLHAKLDRKKKVEGINKNAQQLFQEDMTRYMEKMKELQTHNCNLQVTLCEKLKDSFRKLYRCFIIFTYHAISSLVSKSGT